MRKSRAFFRRNWKPILGGIALGAVACHPNLAHAANAGGGALPWDTPLTTLRNDITGPVAFTISLLAMVACGAALVFGGEVNEFIRRLIMVVLVAAFLVGVTNLASGAGDHRSHRVSLRRTPFFRVLHRPRLFLGGEREPTLMMAIVAAGLAVSGQNIVTLDGRGNHLVRVHRRLPPSRESRPADEPGLHAAAQVSRVLCPALAALSGCGEVIAQILCRHSPSRGCPFVLDALTDARSQALSGQGRWGL